MIRIDAVWMSVEPLDMRAGTETVLARVQRAQSGNEHERELLDVPCFHVHLSCRNLG